MVGIAKAQLDLAKLNLGFTQVDGPDHRPAEPADSSTRATSSRPGHHVLTSIVSLDPMYVYFDLDERTLLKLRRLVNAGKIKSRTEAEIPVLVGLHRRGCPTSPTGARSTSATTGSTPAPAPSGSGPSSATPSPGSSRRASS